MFKTYTPLQPGKYLSRLPEGCAIWLVTTDGEDVAYRHFMPNVAFEIPACDEHHRYESVDGTFEFLSPPTPPTHPSYVLLWLYDLDRESWHCIHLREAQHGSEQSGYVIHKSSKDDEGFCESTESFWLEPDGLHYSIFTRSKDCDGYSQSSGHCVCPFDPFDPTMLKTKRHVDLDELPGISPSFLPFGVPDFQEFTQSLRDHSAEQANY